ncbi:tRNA lysidine(34) synthetase TilS [Sphingomonas paeninsulae]|uniref:tRNA lysidine(34) synthetase TilS n=1 Tax=Sphingomonas paeninsulae TaxID=2319844 RepID=UPI001EF13F51|nr:tRNA lysidine(34) synthetase TilS [Sphingomonas paeninsulae]
MQTPNVLPDSAIARFRADFAKLVGPVTEGLIGIAISGGPDSVALLLLANAAFPGRVEAATVDHRLRTASGDEAAFVANICRDLGLPHRIIVLEELARGNMSASAREARYDALDNWADERDIAWLLTAHHADDQLETMAMRLNRASGVAGLAGIRARRGRILRPLLGWRHRELVQIVAAAGIVPVDDPSNRDDRYDRARLRKALTGADWLDPLAIVRSAAALDEADRALDWVVLKLRSERLFDGADTWTYDAAGLPAELLRRALIDCLRVIDPTSRPRGATIERLLKALQGNATGTIGRVRCAVKDGRWHFTLALPRRPKVSPRRV